MSFRYAVWMAVLGAWWLPMAAQAQSIGTFRWQLQPFCNVLALEVVQSGSGFRLEGTDDQCAQGADKASALGTAFQNPDGTIGIGLSIVVAPGGVPVHVDASLAPGGFSGTWRDSGGQSGAFVFTPGPGTGGEPRPRPLASVPPAITLRHDGGLVAMATGSGAIPASGPGDRMMWHAGKAAFRAGTATGTAWNDNNIGLASFAAGQETRASGAFSTAFGLESVASGLNSMAFGYRSSASGHNSVAGGDIARATGNASVAFGRNLQASGWSSLALGEDVVASGDYSFGAGVIARAGGHSAIAIGRDVSAYGNNSVAIGRRVLAHGTAQGAFLFGDASTNTTLESVTANQFMARFAGGYVLWSTPNTVYPTSPGVLLAPGGSAWASLSDVNSKENFRELSGDEVLDKLAAMPVRTWNYKAQDASIRHAGPTAQDFYAAFGLGEDQRRITTIDADGIALAGVKALEARTRAISERAERLERENLDLRTRLEQLERLLAQR